MANGLPGHIERITQRPALAEKGRDLLGVRAYLGLGSIGDDDRWSDDG